MPRVSVIMPVFNSEKYLSEAIQSILTQSLSDLELVIADDGSTDRSLEIIRSFSDTRIKILINKTNLRQGKTRNKCIDNSTGEYIANLDSDDIAEPQRLERQVWFMDANPEIDICGTYAKIIGETTIREFETADDRIKFRMLFDSPMMNSSVIMRRSVFLNKGLSYNENIDFAQDYDLWANAKLSCRFANIPEVLVNYRLHDGSVTEKHRAIQQQIADEIRLRQIREIGVEMNEEEKKTHLLLLKLNKHTLTANDASAIHTQIMKLIDVNRKVNLYEEDIFESYFRELWAKYVNNYNFSTYNSKLFKTVHFSPLKKSYHLSIRQKIGFFVKCMILFKKSFKY